MSLMPDLMYALNSLQEEIKLGMPVNPCELDKEYKMIFDEPLGRHRFSYAKIIKGEVQALSVFGAVEPIDSIACFNIGYAVNLKYRGRGLGVEAVNKGIEELRNGLRRAKFKSFYIEAVIDVTNIPSLKVAEKLFPELGKAIKDHGTGTPCLHFTKLIVI